MNISIISYFFIALALGLTVVFVVDPLDPTTVSTPFLLGVILMAVSLRQNLILVTAVAIAYTALTCYALVHFHNFMNSVGHVTPHPFFWLFQRMGLYFVLSALAVYLAYYRTGAERVMQRLQTVLSKLPVPVIFSNSVGDIVYTNYAVNALQRDTVNDLVGKSYFEFVYLENTKGKSIRTYFAIFEGDSSGFYSIEFHPFGPENTMNAQMICLGVGANRILITVLLGAPASRPVLDSFPNSGKIDHSSLKF